MNNSGHYSGSEHNLPVPSGRASLQQTSPWGQTVALQPYPTQIPNDEEAGKSSVVEYLQILRRNKRAWASFIFAGVVLGFVLTIWQTRIYQARTSVEVIGLNENFLNMRDANPVSENSNDYETSDVQTQAKILQSDDLMKQTLDKMGLYKGGSPIAPPTIGDYVGHFMNIVLSRPQPKPLTVRDKLLLDAAESLRVRAVGQTRIVEITIDSKDPKLAATFANTLVTQFVEQNLEARLKTTETTSNWLSRQIDEIRSKLEHSEDALQAYAQHSGLIFNNEKADVSSDKLKQLQDALSKATAERTTKQSRYEIAKSAPADTLPEVLDDESLRDTLAQVVELKRQVADLTPIFTDDYGKLKRVQEQLRAVQTAFNTKRDEIVSRIKNEYDQAANNEKLLATAYDAQVAIVTADGEKAIQYNILKREVDSNRQLYDNMLQQLKQSSIASAMKASNLRIVDVASPPGTPYKPKVSVYAALGGIAGALLGAVFLILSARADRTIQKPGDSVLYLNLPELGIIPANRGKAFATGLANKPKAQLTTVQDRDFEKRIELATWQQQPSFLAESFRSTLVSILFANHNGPPPSVFVLTSAGPGEGKSTVASNLAIAVAEVGQRVLLIDADMRRPRQHEIFQVNNNRGLADLLRERVALNGDLSLGGAIRETVVPGLFILPSGPVTSAGTNILYGPHTGALLEYLKGQFDTVFIDTPPMLTIPDARVLGRAADRVILVLRAGQTTRDAALAARQRFAEDGTKIIGTVLNDFEPKNAPNGYYGAYSNKYHYEYHPESKS